MQLQRADKRDFEQLRALRISYDVYGYAAGSVFFEQGNTKILVSVMMLDGVPPFLRGKGSGWLTAEYAMLPASTVDRMSRETAVKRNGRSIEISRLIGRSFRSVVDVSKIGERTIYIDCDVLQADGGTRAASITAACCALQAAQERWLHCKTIREPILKEAIAAVSLGVTKEGELLLDLDYKEDSAIATDFNFVLTKSEKIVEIQGTAETVPLTWEQHEQLCALARNGIRQLFAFTDTHPYQFPGSDACRPFPTFPGRSSQD
jgi:ribonuclease PH